MAATLSQAERAEAISAALGAELAGGAHFGEPIRGLFSIVQPLTLADGRKLAAKFCLNFRTGEPNPADAARQYASLQAVSERMPSDAPCTAPRVYGQHLASGLVLMQWLEGEPLAKRLYSATTLVARQDAMRSAAHWLLAFHQAKPLGSTTLDTRKQLSSMPFDAGVRVPGFIRRALAALKAHEPRVAAIALPRSWIHGDFKLENLLVAGEQIAGLDIGTSGEQAVLHDIAPLLNRLRLARWEPGLLRAIAQWPALESAFVDAYFGAQAVQQTYPLTWLRLSIALHAWHEQIFLHAWHDRHKGLRSAYYGLLYRQDIARLTKRLQHAGSA